MRLAYAVLLTGRHGVAGVCPARAGDRHSGQARRAGLYQRHRRVVGHCRGRIRPRSSGRDDADRDLPAAGGFDAGERSELLSQDRQSSRLWPAGDRAAARIARCRRRRRPITAAGRAGSAAGPVTEYAPYPVPRGGDRTSGTDTAVVTNHRNQKANRNATQARVGACSLSVTRQRVSKGVSCHSNALSWWPWPPSFRSA